MYLYYFMKKKLRLRFLCLKRQVPQFQTRVLPIMYRHRIRLSFLLSGYKGSTHFREGLKENAFLSSSSHYKNLSGVSKHIKCLNCVSSNKSTKLLIENSYYIISISRYTFLFRNMQLAVFFTNIY